MSRRGDARRRRGEARAFDALEGRQLLSARASLPSGYAAEVAAQSFRNARPAPQSPSPHSTRVSIATERPNYAPGQPITMTLTQTVSGNTPVNTGPLGNVDVVVSRRGRELWRYSEDRGPVVASHVLVTLQPGQSRQTTVTWDGRAKDGSIVTGPVEIRAEIDRVSSPTRSVQITPTRPIPPAVAPSQARFGRPSPVAVNSPANAEQVRQDRARQARLAAEAQPRFEGLPTRRPMGALPIGPRRMGPSS